MTASAPVYDHDLFTTEAIAEPYSHYAAIRGLGPVVRLPGDIVAVGRFADVKRALLDHRQFISGDGVGLNPTINSLARGTTLNSDAPLHATLRSIVAAPLSPAAVAELKGDIVDAADGLVARLAAAESFDGIVDLARFLPIAIVSNLVGLPEDGRENMLEWAAATFDCLGPANDRFAGAMPKLSEMIAYTIEQAGPGRVKVGSWAARIYAAAEAGQVAYDEVPALLLDYLGPSLDTTIFATGHLLHLLGSNPEQWKRLQREPELTGNAIDEALRMEAPIRGFSRVAAADCAIGGTAVAAGTRVLLLFASANRDADRWTDPDLFDISRPDAREHLGFGKGRHVCAGQHLAKLEMTALLTAMVRHFPDFETGVPVVQSNNLLRGYAHLPVRVIAR